LSRFSPVILLTRGEVWDLIVRFNQVILLTKGEGWDLIVRFNPVIVLDRGGVGIALYGLTQSYF
jgi:hypothetical protein